MGNQEDKGGESDHSRLSNSSPNAYGYVTSEGYPQTDIYWKTDMAVLLYVCIYMQSRFALELLRGDMYECVYSDASRPSTCLKLITNMIILTKAKCRLKYPTVFAEAEGLFPLCGLGAGG